MVAGHPITNPAATIMTYTAVRASSSSRNPGELSLDEVEVVRDRSEVGAGEVAPKSLRPLTLLATQFAAAVQVHLTHKSRQ